ncbi:MAG TPA: chemotaxis protein CheW [Clostridia bacterium]|nr:chemotaxis protein CheW [Clostridia bacterium]
MQEEVIYDMEGVKQVVVCELNDQKYVLPIIMVKEIIRVVEITKVPDSAQYIEGVINLRGKVIPVLNLSRRLGLVEKETDNDTRIVVCELEEKPVGLIVDCVHEVGQISNTEIEKPDATMGDIDVFSGVVKKEKEVWLLLDLDKIFD